MVVVVVVVEGGKLVYIKAFTITLIVLASGVSLKIAPILRKIVEPSAVTWDVSLNPVTPILLIIV